MLRNLQFLVKHQFIKISNRACSVLCLSVLNSTTFSYQGQLSLPLEAVNKVQSWVEPRFAVETVDNTPRAFQDTEFSEHGM